jgi:uncharacterized protein YggL (DUF469 family)
MLLHLFPITKFSIEGAQLGGEYRVWNALVSISNDTEAQSKEHSLKSRWLFKRQKACCTLMHASDALASCGAVYNTG